MLGLRFCARASSSCGKRGPLFIAVRGPLTIAASPVEGHRLQTRRLSSCGSRAQLLRGTWDLPRPGLEPVSLALAGRFSTTEPPGKPWESYFNQKYAIKTLPSHLFHSNPTKYLWPVTPKILRRCWRLISAEWRWAFFHFSFLFKNNFYIFLIRETRHAHEIIWKIHNRHQKINNPTPRLRDNNLLIIFYISFHCFIYIYIFNFQNWNQAVIIVFCFT